MLNPGSVSCDHPVVHIGSLESEGSGGPLVVGCGERIESRALRVVGD